MEYNDFIKNKVKFTKYFGHNVLEDEINPNLLPHQKAVVAWAVRGGSELNSGYWADSVGYAKAEEVKADMPTLFDLVDVK